jgi:hypothetical protein
MALPSKIIGATIIECVPMASAPSRDFAGIVPSLMSG